jgi:hypothetical protein
MIHGDRGRYYFDIAEDRFLMTMLELPQRPAFVFAEPQVALLYEVIRNGRIRLSITSHDPNDDRSD